MPVVLRRTHKPTPFAFPIMVGRFREKLTSEKLADRVRRMQLEFDRAAPPEGEDDIPGSPRIQQELFA
jgi:ATP-dependent Lhr-like helicase